MGGAEDCPSSKGSSQCCHEGVCSSLIRAETAGGYGRQEERLLLGHPEIPNAVELKGFLGGKNLRCLQDVEIWKVFVGGLPASLHLSKTVLPKLQQKTRPREQMCVRKHTVRSFWMINKCILCTWLSIWRHVSDWIVCLLHLWVFSPDFSGLCVRTCRLSFLWLITACFINVFITSLAVSSSELTLHEKHFLEEKQQMVLIFEQAVCFQFRREQLGWKGPSRII